MFFSSRYDEWLIRWGHKQDHFHRYFKRKMFRRLSKPRFMRMLSLLVISASTASALFMADVAGSCAATNGSDQTSARGFPDATNTGVPAGVTLTPSGGLKITTPGAVISGLNISGTVTIDAPNVTLKDCIIQGIGWYQVEIAPGITGTTVKNCTINAGGNGTNPYALCGIGDNGSNSMFLNNNISNFEHGISLINGGGSGDLIQGNYIHDFFAPSSLSPHYDGIEINGPASNVTITGNTIINNQNQTSAIMIDNYYGLVSNIDVNSNLLVGGAYTIFVDAQFRGGSITGVKITNNRLGKGHWGYVATNRTSPVLIGNVDDITGVLLHGQQAVNPRR
jgi:hypothetical protein